MTRMQQLVVCSWFNAIQRAIALGEVDAAGRLSTALVRRLRELGVR